ncbi:recombinase family protein [Enterobacter cloacae subsp. cloacae]|nr:recombinase family protein [Enterobacter cloacae subsp. cloacae]
MANRPALKKLLRALNEGDTLVVWKLDRLWAACEIWCWWTNSGSVVSTLRASTDSIDTSSPMGRLIFHIMSALGGNGEGVDCGTYLGR